MKLWLDQSYYMVANIRQSQKQEQYNPCLGNEILKKCDKLYKNGHNT